MVEVVYHLRERSSEWERRDRVKTEKEGETGYEGWAVVWKSNGNAGTVDVWLVREG
jgi:hypothetical protein